MQGWQGGCLTDFFLVSTWQVSVPHKCYMVAWISYDKHQSDGELGAMMQVYAVASEDMDSLTFGSTRFLRHLMEPTSRKIPVMEFEIAKVTEWTVTTAQWCCSCWRTRLICLITAFVIGVLRCCRSWIWPWINLLICAFYVVVTTVTLFEVDASAPGGHLLIHFILESSIRIWQAPKQ